MDFNGAGAVKPFKVSHSNRSNAPEHENSNPNFTSPGSDMSKTAAEKSATRNTKLISNSSPINIREEIESPKVATFETEAICSSVKRRREQVMEEARENVPESGRVKHLVEAFEKFLSIAKTSVSDQKDPEDSRNIRKWALPGLQTRVEMDLLLTSESLGRDSSCVFTSLNHARNSVANRRNRRNSTESTGTFVGICKGRPRKITSQKPFMLRTEQRGRSKKEEFIRKVQQMMTDEEKQRIPIAQGLPWTTEEPECLVKPPVKENTKPIDLVLHSDVRAVERAEFDHQVAEKMSLLEQYKLEIERKRKLAEEKEIRRLRMESVPKAHPMPYFDRPFVPKRSEKQLTIPKEPRFHVPQHKKIKCPIYWNDLYIRQQ